MARRARLASRDPAVVLADDRNSGVRGRPGRSGCVAGTPSRSPPRKREDVTGPQRAGLGSPPRVTGAAHRDSRPGSPLNPRNWQILVHLGRNKKLSADLGTLEEYRQEVKSMNKMS